KRPTQVHAQHSVPVLDRKLIHRRRHVHPGIVHQHVELAAAKDGVVDARACLGLVGHVHSERKGLTPAVRQALSDPVGPLEAHVRHDHGNAQVGQRQADALTQPAASAGDEGYSPLEQAHGHHLPSASTDRRSDVGSGQATEASSRCGGRTSSRYTTWARRSLKRSSSISSHMVWIRSVWTSWMRCASVDGTINARSASLRTASPLPPSSARVVRPDSRAAWKASTRFCERPVVLRPTSTSPERPKAFTWRAKTCSKPTSLPQAVRTAPSVVSASAGSPGRLG